MYELTTFSLFHTLMLTFLNSERSTKYIDFTKIFFRVFLKTQFSVGRSIIVPIFTQHPSKDW